MDIHTMNQDSADYTCPYCRWNVSHTWSQTREEEELIDRKYLGEDIEKTYFLDTKHKFKVKICSKCAKALKVRSNIIWTLFSITILAVAVALIVALTEKFFTSDIVDKIGLYSVYVIVIAGSALVLFRLLWRILGPSRAHVKFERARNCNAIE